MRIALRLVVFAVMSQAISVGVPVIDGKIDPTEWVGAHKGDLSGGGKVWVLQRGGFIYVAVRGARPGLASLCAFQGDTVRILHASAATGEARFSRSAGAWIQTAGFEWRLRDSSLAGGPVVPQYDEMVQEIGWTANPSGVGSPDREFRIRADIVDALAVTFLATAEPMTLAYWPSTVADDCRINLRIAQGFLPASATFDPSGWYRIQKPAG